MHWGSRKWLAISTKTSLSIVAERYRTHFLSKRLMTLTFDLWPVSLSWTLLYLSHSNSRWEFFWWGSEHAQQLKVCISPSDTFWIHLIQSPVWLQSCICISLFRGSIQFNSYCCSTELYMWGVSDKDCYCLEPIDTGYLDTGNHSSPLMCSSYSWKGSRVTVKEVRSSQAAYVDLLLTELDYCT